MSITGILETFKGFFSRGFWLGTFLPLATFAAINLTILAFAFPGSVVRDEWLKTEQETLTNSSLAIVALVVLGFAIAPLIPTIRGVLDGRFLPGWLYDILRADRLASAMAIRQAKTEALNAFGELEKLETDLIGRLKSARKTGIGPVKPPPAPNADLLRAARNAVGVLVELQSGGGMPTAADLEGAGSQLEAALKTGWNIEIDEIHRTMVDLLATARSSARSRVDALETRYFGIALDSPQATRIGDARMMVESYTRKMYNAEYAYIWPRIQLAIPKEDALLTRIETAEAQADFSALSLLLALATSVVWPVVLIAYLKPMLWILAPVALGPLLAALFYRLLLESQMALGDVVKLAIDSNRLKLLTDVLRQPPPATLSAERELWATLHAAETGEPEADLVYKYPPP